MGKVTGFLEFERHDRGYEPVAERVKTWKEFVVPLSEQDLRDQAARCMNCGIPYCHGTGSVQPGTPGCPVNNQIPDWNDLVYTGNWEEAARNLHSTNNFPEVTGRVCPAPCEASCTLNLDDNPVTIKSIECEIADRSLQNGWIKPEPASVKTGKRVAVIGRPPPVIASRAFTASIVDFCKSQGAAIGIQIGHCGRKARNQVPWEGRSQMKRAKDILANWKTALTKFRKVMPVEFRRALLEMKAREADQPKIAIGA